LAGAATVKVAEAILPLWWPLAWKVSCRPGIVEPAKPLGTANEAVIWPLVVALVVVSTVAPKLTSTGSERANPRQERVTRDPDGPVFGERAHLGLVRVTVVGVVVPVDAAVGWVVAPAVGLVVGADEALEEDAAAVWSALRDAQPVTARAAMKTAVAMIRTGRMVIPPNSYDPVSPRHHQPRLGRSRHGRRSASPRPRTGLNLVAIFQPMSTPGATGAASPGRAVTGFNRAPE
jgi:hypothetical protein